MFFTVITGSATEGRSQAFLTFDRWDDWGKYRTQFYLTVFDEEGKKHSIGSVKIGEVGLQPAPASNFTQGQRAPTIGEGFENLDATFFSLGQGEDYYASLNGISEYLREKVLLGLRDVAYDIELLEQHIGELVMTESVGFHAELSRFFHREVSHL